MGDLVLPVTAPGATHVYHQYIIRTRDRNALQKYLSENKIGTLIHYPIPPHLQEAYAHLGFKKGQLPIAEMIANTCLSLPVWPGMKKEHIDHIQSALSKYFSQL
jgi:dTDP-4-amino-4,6-dideoxygalactose transaminase